MIYHIAERAAWPHAQWRGRYTAPSLEAEGFIHFSQREQILDVAHAFYRGRSNLLLLCIDETKLEAELRWEAPAHPHSADISAAPQVGRFPHLYGELNMDAVAEVFALPWTEAGFRLPPGLP